MCVCVHVGSKDSKDFPKQHIDGLDLKYLFLLLRAEQPRHLQGARTPDENSSKQFSGRTSINNRSANKNEGLQIAGNPSVGFWHLFPAWQLVKNAVALSAAQPEKQMIKGEGLRPGLCSYMRRSGLQIALQLHSLHPSSAAFTGACYPDWPPVLAASQIEPRLA